MPCSDEPHGSPQWIVEDGQVLGEIALRHWYREEIDDVVAIAILDSPTCD